MPMDTEECQAVNSLLGLVLKYGVASKSITLLNLVWINFILTYLFRLHQNKFSESSRTQVPLIKAI